MTFDREHKTPVKRGENAGETLSNYHVVREMDAIGHWTGEALEIALTRAEWYEIYQAGTGVPLP